MVRLPHGFHCTFGNMKLGTKVGNFSTTPGTDEKGTCSTDVCFDQCYAMKAYRQYPAVRDAWDENTRLLKVERRYDDFEEDIIGFVLNSGRRGGALRRFRFSVAGDIFSEEYLDSMCRIARACPDTRFWTYTKAYGILEGYVEDHEIPGNFNVILSAWKDYQPNDHLRSLFAVANYDDGTTEMPRDSFICPGSCAKCSWCEHGSAGEQLVFHHH